MTITRKVGVRGKWRFSISLLQSKLNNSATFTSEPQSYHSDAGYKTIMQILGACKSPPNLSTAIAMHAQIVKHGYGMYPSMLSLLISIYVTCKCHNLACELQKEICYQNVDAVSANLIISSFMKIGEINIAKNIFRNVPSRDVVTWNSLIGGCVKNASFREALSIFREMLRTSIEPDGFTFASIITACARLGALHHGKWIHGPLLDFKVPWISDRNLDTKLHDHLILMSHSELKGKRAIAVPLVKSQRVEVHPFLLGIVVNKSLEIPSAGSAWFELSELHVLKIPWNKEQLLA